MKSNLFISITCAAILNLSESVPASAFQAAVFPVPGDVVMAATISEAGTKALNPQPLPPSSDRGGKLNTRALNPQPLPPSGGDKANQRHPGDPIKSKSKARKTKAD